MGKACSTLLSMRKAYEVFSAELERNETAFGARSTRKDNIKVGQRNM
jgi:hypothetical protein